MATQHSTESKMANTNRQAEIVKARKMVEAAHTTAMFAALDTGSTPKAAGEIADARRLAMAATLVNDLAAQGVRVTLAALLAR